VCIPGSVSLGTPLVTLPSHQTGRRVASAVLTRMGMQHLIAHSPAHLVELAVHLATNASARMEAQTRLLARRDLVEWTRWDLSVGPSGVEGEVEEPTPSPSPSPVSLCHRSLVDLENAPEGSDADTIDIACGMVRACSGARTLPHCR
jgi:hypothetical protein